MSDVWKPIAGFEGLYEVAPCGAIRNARTLRWLSPSKKDDGYMSVKLFRGGVGRNITDTKSNFLSTGLTTIKVILRPIADGQIGPCKQTTAENHP